MKFKVIAAEKANVPVQRACTLLGVSESGYYAWVIRKPAAEKPVDRKAIEKGSPFPSREASGTKQMGSVAKF